MEKSKQVDYTGDMQSKQSKYVKNQHAEFLRSLFPVDSLKIKVLKLSYIF